MLIYKDKCSTQALKHIDQYITSGRMDLICNFLMLLILP